MKIVRSRVAAVVAGAGVLVAMGGVGGAVAGNLINSRDIQDGTIRSVDIHDGAVREAQVSPWIADQLHKAGTPGPQGPAGADGTTLDYVLSDALSPAAGGWGGMSCPAGETAVGGGVLNGVATSVTPVVGPAAYPHYTYKRGESGVAVQFAQAGDNVKVYAVCATLSLSQPAQP